MQGHGTPIEGSVETDAGNFSTLGWPSNDTHAPPVLLLHGFNQTRHSWDEVGPGLAEHFPVSAFDQRGHGDSMRSEGGDYSRASMADDVGRVADALGLERFHLVGMSMGAVHAISYAVKAPERLHSLVVVDYAPQVEKSGTGRIAALLMQRWENLDAAVTAIRMFNPRRSEANVRERLTHSMRPQDDGRWGWKVDPAFATQGRFSEDSETMWAQVSQVRTRTLVLRGAQSDVLSEAAAERMQDTLPQGELAVVSGAGHSIAGDNPDGFLQAVVPFLRS